jgi:hypothetical protein
VLCGGMLWAEEVGGVERLRMWVGQVVGCIGEGCAASVGGVERWISVSSRV